MTEKTERTQTQCDKIMRYMKTHKKGITQALAVDLFSCYRLSARIHDIREMGYEVTTIQESKKNDDGHVVNYARYVLEG